MDVLCILTASLRRTVGPLYTFAAKSKTGFLDSKAARAFLNDCLEYKLYQSGPTVRRLYLLLFS